MADFFTAGRTYHHPAEGLFAVVYVGTAPEPYEHHSETLGVAFGWRQGVGADGAWEALGAYETPDFYGWVAVTAVNDLGAEPNGCRWCGDAPGHHGTQYTPGIGQHRWAQPSDRQRLERMQARKAARTTTAPTSQEQ